MNNDRLSAEGLWFLAVLAICMLGAVGVSIAQAIASTCP